VAVSRVGANMALISAKPEALHSSQGAHEGIPPYPPPGAQDDAVVATIGSILERKGAVEVAALPKLLGGWDTPRLGRVFDVVSHRPDRFVVEFAHSTSAKVRLASDTAAEPPLALRVDAGAPCANGQASAAEAAVSDEVDDLALLWEQFGGSGDVDVDGETAADVAVAAGGDGIGTTDVVVSADAAPEPVATDATVAAADDMGTEVEEPSFDLSGGDERPAAPGAMTSEPLPANSFHLKVYPNVPVDGSWVGLADLAAKARWSPGVQRRFGPLVVQLESVYGNAVEVDHATASCRRRKGGALPTRPSPVVSARAEGDVAAAELDPGQRRTILDAVPSTAPIALDDLVVVVSGQVTAAEAMAALAQCGGEEEAVTWSASEEGCALVQRTRPAAGVGPAPRAMILSVLAQHLRTEGASLTGLEASTQWAQLWSQRLRAPTFGMTTNDS